MTRTAQFVRFFSAAAAPTGKPPAAGGKAGGKPGAKAPEAPKYKYKHELHIPPQREPLEEGKQDYPIPDRDLMYQPIQGLWRPDQEHRACYMGIEHMGKVYHIFDASRISYGRMCSKIATFLQGKHKPTFWPDQPIHGDTVIVVNAGNPRFTGKKRFHKEVIYHSGYVGHLHRVPIRKFIEEKPEQLVHLSVSKMLPKNTLRPEWLKKLFVFRGPNHHMSKYLPTFAPFVQQIDPEHLFKEASDPKKTVITYESVEDNAEEFKDMKREIDPELTNLESAKKYKISPTQYNVQVKKEANRFRKILQRYKEHRYKPTKPVDPKNRIVYKGEREIKESGHFGDYEKEKAANAAKEMSPAQQAAAAKAAKKK